MSSVKNRTSKGLLSIKEIQWFYIETKGNLQYKEHLIVSYRIIRYSIERESFLQIFYKKGKLFL